MPTIVLETLIRATPAACFDAARDLDLHVHSMAHSGERAIAGRTSGHIEMGEEVTWRARHFGFMHEHQSRITAFDRPRHFRDSMVRGRFRSFEHDHHFEPAGEGATLMRDVLAFRSPLGPLGALVDALVLKAYLRRMLERRNETIRARVEPWQRSAPTRLVRLRNNREESGASESCRC